MIKIDGLKKKYKDFELDISMDIKEGTVTGLIGKNGAGKSTAIKAILGLIHPDAGSIKVMGDVPGKNMENIGAAFSDSGMSMLYNINDISCIMHAMYDEFEEDKFKELCQKMELPFDKLLKDFSSGMKAKLKVLLTISHKAKLLVLDEPTTGLDVLARNEVMDMLRQYLEEDATRSILIITINLE